MVARTIGDRSVAGSREHLGQCATPEELAARGATDIESLDSPAFVREQTPTRDAHQQACKARKVPFQNEFPRLQLRTTADFAEEPLAYAAELKGNHVPLALDACDLRPESLLYVHRFVTEVAHRAEGGSAINVGTVLAYRLAKALGEAIASTAMVWEWRRIREQGNTGISTGYAALPRSGAALHGADPP